MRTKEIRVWYSVKIVGYSIKYYIGYLEQENHKNMKSYSGKFGGSLINYSIRYSIRYLEYGEP